METVSAFFDHNIVVIYFFYGLAFFCMGLIVWIESGRASSFRLAQGIAPLAAFGILHGLHEWFEMFQRLAQSGVANIPAWLLSNELRLGHLVLSFILLLVFGVRLIYANRSSEGGTPLLVYGTTGALVGVWVGSVLITHWLYQPEPARFLTAVDVLTRYILGIPGALLAAWAIILEQQTFKDHGMPETGRDLLRAALALLLYGVIGQIFVQPSFLFPSTIINATLFVSLFGIPIQLFRAFMAAVVAFFVIRSLRAFEVERQQNLAQAQEARLVAQRQALQVQQAAHAETEKLNEALQTAVQELTLLFDISQHLTATLDRDLLLKDAITRITNNLSWVSQGIVVLREKSGKPLNCAACDGCQNGCTPVEESPCQQAREITQYVEETAQSILCSNGRIIELDPVTPDQDDEIIYVEPKTSISLPLLAQDNIVGSFTLTLKPEVCQLRGRDLWLLRTIAGQLSIAIENATRYEELQAREELRGELLHQVVSAQEGERQRIARELHDGTGQVLTALGLGFAAASRNVLSNPDLAAHQLSELKQMSMQALEDLHHVIRDLRPSLLDDLGLVPAVQSQAQEFQTRTAIPVQFEVNGRRRRLQPEVETILFRIAQEALTNIARHAHAHTVQMTFTFGGRSVQLRVQDDGCGFQLDDVLDEKVGARHAWGLLGMQERVALVGGHCAITSQPNAGTIIEVSVPLQSVAAEEISYA